MALTSDGELYSWGLNFKGQLGVSDFENRSEPVLIDSFYGGLSNNVDRQSQSKRTLAQMLKQSHSKETSAVPLGS